MEASGAKLLNMPSYERKTAKKKYYFSTEGIWNDISTILQMNLAQAKRRKRSRKTRGIKQIQFPWIKTPKSSPAACMRAGLCPIKYSPSRPWISWITSLEVETYGFGWLKIPNMKAFTRKSLQFTRICWRPGIFAPNKTLGVVFHGEGGLEKSAEMVHRELPKSCTVRFDKSGEFVERTDVSLRLEWKNNHPKKTTHRAFENHQLQRWWECDYKKALIQFHVGPWKLMFIYRRGVVRLVE